MGIRLRNLDYLRDDLRDDPDSLSDSCLDPYQLEAARIMEQDLEMGEAAAPRTAADTLRRWLANEPANRVIYDGMERIGRPIDLLEQALAEAAAPTSPDVVEWFVHNHGPSEGKGTACHEYRVNGRLLGECLLRSHEPEPQFVGGRWDCSCGWHAAKANAQIWWDHVAAALPASPDVVSVKKVLDRIVANDLAFGKPLTTEYPSRAMLRNDVKELAALLFGDSFHATDPDAKEAGE
jgi:hypothetical protein